MSMSEERIVNLKISRLRPDPDNVNVHNEVNIAQIRASIERFGFLDPIGVVRDTARRGYYTIVEGHGRREAAEELEMQEVPCIILSLTEAERMGYAIAHNQTQQISTMNQGVIAAEFRRLNVVSEDYLSLGFSEEDVAFMPGMRDAPSAPEATGGEEGDPRGPQGENSHPAADNGIGANHEAWKGFVPPVHRTSLRFANEISYNRFCHALTLLRDRYPTAGTTGERLISMLQDMIGVEAAPETENA